ELTRERSQGDNNNGEFGTIEAVQNRRQEVLAAFTVINLKLKDWLRAVRCDLSSAECDTSLESVRARLHLILQSLPALNHRYGSDYSFTAAIAEEGHLPLFGLPVRSVSFIHRDPNSGDNAAHWPIRAGVIDRGEDVALSEFAPDHEIVKDKR